MCKVNATASSRLPSGKKLTNAKTTTAKRASFLGFYPRNQFLYGCVSLSFFAAVSAKSRYEQFKTANAFVTRKRISRKGNYFLPKWKLCADGTRFYLHHPFDGRSLPRSPAYKTQRIAKYED
jgi:hypothetical protein